MSPIRQSWPAQNGSGVGSTPTSPTQWGMDDVGKVAGFWPRSSLVRSQVPQLRLTRLQAQSSTTLASCPRSSAGKSDRLVSGRPSVRFRSGARGSGQVEACVNPADGTASARVRVAKRHTRQPEVLVSREGCAGSSPASDTAGGRGFESRQPLIGVPRLCWPKARAVAQSAFRGRTRPDGDPSSMRT